MNNYVLIAEAIKQLPFKREHLSYLLREGKIKGHKVGGVWLIDLDDLREYHKRMEELGPHKYNPRK